MVNDVIDIPEEALEKAISAQEEFIRRFYEKYQMTPEFDVLILAIMNELKYRKQVEKSSDDACK